MKKHYPLVSVVMPTYNGGKTIQRAIKSVLKQEYPNLELIVVDDASKDNTIEIVEGIKDTRIRIVKHSTNRNGSAARNTGIKNSKGEYIAFLDDDDEWLPEKLSEQIKYLEEKDPSIFKAVVSSYSIESGKGWREVIQKQEGDITKEIFLMQISLAAGSNLLIHRDVVKEIGLFNEKYLRHQDMEFVLRYLRIFKLATIPIPLSLIHGHSGRVSGEKMLRVKERFLKDFQKDIEKLGRKISKRIYARQWLQVSKHYSLDGDIRNTLKYLFESLSYGLLFSNRCKILILENYIALPYHLLKGLIKKGQSDGR
jgi:glycosyltransferase involved in cell wall biosynthesis